MHKNLKKLIVGVCILGIVMSCGLTAFAADTASENSDVAVSTAPIGTQQNIVTPRADVSGVAYVKLHAIGSGLVDADWEVIMSKGLLTNINMTLTIKHGFLFLFSDNYSIWRKANWTSAEYGSVQTSWDVGTQLKCDLTGTIEVNGQFDYPVNTFDYGVTTVK